MGVILLRPADISVTFLLISVIMFHSATILNQISAHPNTLPNQTKTLLCIRHCFPFLSHLAPPCIPANLIQFPSVECDGCHPECSSSSWPFCGWSGRSPGGTTAATGRRRRNTWCCVSAASRSTSSWTSSMSSLLTRDYRSLQIVLSRTIGYWGLLCLLSVILFRRPNS